MHYNWKNTSLLLVPGFHNKFKDVNDIMYGSTLQIEMLIRNPIDAVQQDCIAIAGCHSGCYYKFIPGLQKTYAS